MSSIVTLPAPGLRRPRADPPFLAAGTIIRFTFSALLLPPSGTPVQVPQHGGPYSTVCQKLPGRSSRKGGTNRRAGPTSLLAAGERGLGEALNASAREGEGPSPPRGMPRPRNFGAESDSLRGEAHRTAEAPPSCFFDTFSGPLLPVDIPPPFSARESCRAWGRSPHPFHHLAPERNPEAQVVCRFGRGSAKPGISSPLVRTYRLPTSRGRHDRGCRPTC
jgi:hypothetical protein